MGGTIRGWNPIGGLWGPPSLLYNGCQVILPQGQVDHLALRLNKRVELYLCSLYGSSGLLWGEIYFFVYSKLIAKKCRKYLARKK